MDAPAKRTPASGLLNRWLYVLALPALLLNYLAVTAGVLLLGGEAQASLLSLSLNFLFAFPLALVAFVLLVAVRTQMAAARLPQSIVGGMWATLGALLTATLTYAPSGIGPRPVSGSSFASRALGLDASASAALASLALWGFAAVLLYLIPVCAVQLRQLRASR